MWYILLILLSVIYTDQKPLIMQWIWSANEKIRHSVGGCPLLVVVALTLTAGIASDLTCHVTRNNQPHWHVGLWYASFCLVLTVTKRVVFCLALCAWCELTPALLPWWVCLLCCGFVYLVLFGANFRGLQYIHIRAAPTIQRNFLL